MAINADHWTVERDTGAIRYIGSDHGGSPLASYATVIELHRWLQGLADDQTAAGSDDEVDITELLPSTRSTDNIITLINGYNIDDTAAEHLYDGSIIQYGGDEIYDGIVNYGNADVQIQILQDGAVLQDDWWNQAGVGLNADSLQGISHRFMIKTRTGSPSADIDNRKLIGTARRFGKTYSEFTINSTARGNNVLALSDVDDGNNATGAGTVATWTSITNVTEGFYQQDVDGVGGNEDYYSQWDVDKPTRSINEFYERMKWLTRDGAADDSPHILLYGLDPELFRGITHELDVDGGSGTWGTPEYEEITWDTGSAQLLAVDNKTGTSTTKIWFQLLTGTVPTDNDTITGTTSSATAVADTSTGSLTERAISSPFIGSSTGTAISGAYGIGIQSGDLTSADKLIDLTNTEITPPNNVNWNLAGLVHNEDYALVAPWDGSSVDANGDPAIYKGFHTLRTTLNGAGETAIVVDTNSPDEGIPSWIPASGTLRVTNDDGLDRYLAYTSYTGSTYTIASTAFNGATGTVSYQATAGNTVYPTMLDTLNNQSPESSVLTFSSVNTVNQNLVVIVRDGQSTPIKQYIATAVLGSNDSTTTAIRTTDA